LSSVGFIDAGATLHARTAEELEAAVRLALDVSEPRPEVIARTKTQARAFLSAEYHALDGRSAARCAEAIGRLD
jgi:hypothetical protein